MYSQPIIDIRKESKGWAIKPMSQSRCINQLVSDSQDPVSYKGVPNVLT
jgi:hypothetical protein